MFVEVSRVIDATIDQAWALLADWGGAKKIFTICQSCVAHGEGLGATRVIRVKGDRIGELNAGKSHDLAGHELRETCVQFDPVQHVLSYAVEEPNPLPVINYVATVRLVAIDEARTRVTWSSQSQPKIPEADARGLFESSYLDGIDGIERCAIAARSATLGRKEDI